MVYTEVTVETAIKTSDGGIAEPCFVYWVTVVDNGGSVLVQLNDSLDDGGSDKWKGGALQYAQGHAVFDPPISFATGCFVDIQGTTPSVTVGYTTQKKG